MKSQLIKTGYLFLLFLLLLSSCEETPNDDSKEVNFKMILKGGEHFFRCGNVDEYSNPLSYKVWYTDSFNFKTYSEYLIEDNIYTVFVVNYYKGEYKDDSIAGWVFYPVRYNDGKYYEKRNINNNNFEPVILKDGIIKGDNWTELYNESTRVDTFNFAVTEFYDSLIIAEKIYYNVYQVKEEYRPGDNSYTDYENYKFYNQEFGLLKMILPPYYSGFYVRAVYERLENL